MYPRIFQESPMVAATRSRPAAKPRTAKSPTTSNVMIRIDGETFASGTFPFGHVSELMKAWRQIARTGKTVAKTRAKKAAVRGAPARK
jgi:hypothetical protein